MKCFRAGLATCVRRSLLLPVLTAVLVAFSPTKTVAQDEVLVFSRTEGFRHSSIPAGIRMVRELGQENGFGVTDTEDPGAFTSDNLAGYGAVVFLNTTGNVLNPAQQTAFEDFIRGGGGFVGIHSAADTEYDWEFYGELVGAYFKSHPQIQHAEVLVADGAHPSTSMLPRRWNRRDEWYNFRSNPRGKVHVLATVHESSYSGGEMGHDHPIAWCRPYAGGRSWYTAGGHTEESFSEELYRKHVLGGLQYALGQRPGDCTATIEDSWSKTVLEPDTDDPMELAVARDGRIFFVERGGNVRVLDRASGTTSTIGNLDVYTGQEDGLLGIALDPDFSTNGWMYLFYSPAGPEAKQHVSRFTLSGNALDMSSEQVLLEIPTQRDECCHAGGSPHVWAGWKPLRVDWRRHESLRVRRLRPARRAPGTLTLGRPEVVGKHE